jgi:RNA polymerase sigma-70 factor (ECF subfamily)
MSHEPLKTVVGYIRKISSPPAEGEVADAELVRRFVAHRDESAFAALVRRHGSLVLGICRRLLRREHDAEDAFQATFLVLVRKAASIGKRACLRSWLYSVAYRVALRARADSARYAVLDGAM